MKKYIGGMVLGSCILFCTGSFLGCGEAETSEQTDNVDQAEEDEMLLYEQVEEDKIGYANAGGSRMKMDITITPVN